MRSAVRNGVPPFWRSDAAMGPLPEPWSLLLNVKLEIKEARGARPGSERSRCHGLSLFSKSARSLPLSEPWVLLFPSALPGPWQEPWVGFS